tara:strand:+ start:2592 stop:3431 length:840 start_codon:yes stop_codon:yes gene_type:complete
MNKADKNINIDYKSFSNFKEKIDIGFDFILENLYEYGPDFQDKNKIYSVSNIESKNDITRIYINFTVDGFPNAGEEYIELDNENKILTRRVIKYPKLKKPVILIATMILSVLLAIFVIPWIFLNSDNVDPLYKSGKVLWLKSESPIYQNIVSYQGPEASTNNLTNWQIENTDKSTYVGLIKLQIINETANTITINIDENCAEILASNGKTYSPVNTILRATPAENKSKNFEVKDFVPLWGNITLIQGTQVSGYLITDLPKDVTIRRLRWISSDTVTINY